MHKDTQKWALIDIAVLADQNITRTEEEKVKKYQELAFEIRRIHGASKVTTIPIVIGALRSTSKGSKTWFGKLDIPDFLGSVQWALCRIVITWYKSAILGRKLRTGTSKTKAS